MPSTDTEIKKAVLQPLVRGGSRRVRPALERIRSELQQLVDMSRDHHRRNDASPLGHGTRRFAMRKFALAVLVGVSLSVLAPASGQDAVGEAADQEPIAEARVSGTLLTLVPRITYARAVLRVVGPDNYEARKVFEGNGVLVLDLLADGYIEVAVGQDGYERLGTARGQEQETSKTVRISPPVLRDGRYRYEGRLTAVNGQTSAVSGSFQVLAGAVAPSAATRSVEAEEVGPNLLNEPEAVDIQDDNNNGLTRLSLEANDFGGNILELWELRNDDGDFFICESGGNLGGPCASPVTILQDSDGNVGIGTTAPAVDLHIVSGNTELRLEDTGDNAVWDLQTLFGEFEIEDALTGNDVLTLDEGAPHHAMFVDSSGKLGLGTGIPEDRLHLVHTDPTVRFTETDGNQSVFRLRVDTVSGTRRFVIQEGDTFQPLLSIDQDTGRVGLGNASLARSAFEIAPRAGDAHLRLASDDGPGWMIDGNDRAMTVSREGSGVQELILRDHLDATGPTLAVNGSVQGTQCINTSSRAMKTGFTPVEPATVLAKVAELPITSWRYRHEREGVQHLGPVAEDFRALFGLGDGETISTVDANGVLMAAVQALSDENRRLEARLRAVEQALQTDESTETEE